MHISIILAFISSLARVLGDTRVILPLYSVPGTSQWTTLQSTAVQYPDLTFIVIIDVNNGPGGPNPSSNWVNGVSALTAHNNIRVIGYVYTSYGNRSISSVESDVSNWEAWPVGLSGIFFDETADDNTPYYRNITSYTRPLFPNSIVFLNPGAVPKTNDYFSFVDEVVIHEEPYRQYQQPGNSGVPSGVSFSQLSVIVYSLPSRGSALSTLVTGMVSSGYGSIYLTNAGDSYSSLGSDWDTFVSLLNAANNMAGGTTSITNSSSSKPSTSNIAAERTTHTTANLFTFQTTTTSTRHHGFGS